MVMKNQLVQMDINDLVKADWNYKTDGTEEQIEKLCNSIKEDSSVGVLAVREHKKKFEVIDGNHRLEAVKRLKWKKVPCENFGKISKPKAITIARRRNNQWFNDDAVKYADLFKNIVLSEFNIDELSKFMPESKEDLTKLSKLTDFNWSEFDKEGIYEDDGLKTVKLILPDGIYKLWQQWKEKCNNILEYDSENACFEYAIVEALNIPDGEIELKNENDKK